MISPAIVKTAQSLYVEPAALASIINVESSGSGMGLTGAAVIRLEVHLLWSKVSVEHRPLVDARFRVDGPAKWQGHKFLNAAGTWVPMHTGQVLEWVALSVAQSIDADAACRSTSWGMGQVLGDWTHLGFKSLSEFLQAQTTVDGQIDTMARFIKENPSLLTALKAKDWHTFARGYNGSGKVDDYAGKLAAEYAKLK